MRLAHCSDLHLLSHDGARWLDLANKRWIGAMNLLSSRSRHYHVTAFEDMVEDMNALGVEHVLCTGDVTNLALRREFEFARAKFDKLALGPNDVTVIPGNHDAYVAEGVPLFSEVFGPYAQPDPGWEWAEDHRHSADDILHWPIVRVRGELAVIGLSTSRSTPWFTAYGSLGQGQCARLKKVLSDPRLTNKVRVVAIHHPPAGVRARSRIRGLRDHLAFAHVIAECGAELIVHGHEHRDLVESLGGPEGASVAVRGVASGTYLHNKVDRIARYRIYDIVDGRIVGDHVRIWDRDSRKFAPDGVHQGATNVEDGTRDPERSADRS
jgi:3',5'-cyclic AMP phosphodiesterase CpdA